MQDMTVFGLLQSSSVLKNNGSCSVSTYFKKIGNTTDDVTLSICIFHLPKFEVMFDIPRSKRQRYCSNNAVGQRNRSVCSLQFNYCSGKRHRVRNALNWFAHRYKSNSSVGLPCCCLYHLWCLYVAFRLWWHTDGPSQTIKGNVTLAYVFIPSVAYSYVLLGLLSTNTPSLSVPHLFRPTRPTLTAFSL